MNLRRVLRLSLLVFAVSVLVCLPFLVFGEEAFTPVLEHLRQHTAWLAAAAIALLALDAILPVPSAWVLILLALEGGLPLGIIGGSFGLCAGVLVSTWIGRAAIGRLAPRFVPEAEITRLRESILRHTTLTLACMRSVPVLAETSVMIAAAAGVSTWRIFLATLFPNIAIATVYAVAASDSILTASIAFVATIGSSYLFWRLFEAFPSNRAGPSRPSGHTDPAA